MTDDIDRMLDQSLSEDFDEMRSATPLPAPRYAPVASRRGTFRRRLRFGVPLVLGTNMLVGLSVVTIAAASVGAKTVVTGSPNPLVWGGHHSAQVSPSNSPDDHGGRGRSPESEPTSTSRGSASPGGDGGNGSGSDDRSPQPSSDSGKDGASKGGGHDSTTSPTSSSGGHDDSPPSTPSDGSHH